MKRLTSYQRVKLCQWGAEKLPVDKIADKLGLPERVVRAFLNSRPSQKLHVKEEA